MLEYNKEIVLVGSDANMINDKGNCIGYYKYPDSHETLIERLYNFISKENTLNIEIKNIIYFINKI